MFGFSNVNIYELLEFARFATALAEDLSSVIRPEGKSLWCTPLLLRTGEPELQGAAQDGAFAHYRGPGG